MRQATKTVTCVVCHHTRTASGMDGVCGECHRKAYATASKQQEQDYLGRLLAGLVDARGKQVQESAAFSGTDIQRMVKLARKRHVDWRSPQPPLRFELRVRKLLGLTERRRVGRVAKHRKVS